MRVSPNAKRFGAVMCLMAMAFFAGWPFWSWLNARAVSAQLRARTEALVDRNPHLQPAWAIAIEDDVLTLPESKVIIEAAGEKLDAGE
jgi:hypothetical protein